MFIIRSFTSLLMHSTSVASSILPSHDSMVLSVVKELILKLSATLGGAEEGLLEITSPTFRKG